MTTLTGLEKAALLLQQLGPGATEAVLGRLQPPLAERLRTQMKQLALGGDHGEAVQAVLRELEQALASNRGAPAPGETRVDSVVGDETPPDAGLGPLPADPLLALRKLPAEYLSGAVVGESARTVALVLNQIDEGSAADVYKHLPADLRREVSLQLANQSGAAPEVLRRIAHGIVQKSLALARGAPPGGPAAQIRKMAALLRQLERQERLEVLAGLAQKNAAMAQKLKNELYRFEDLPRLDNASMQKLLAEIDAQSLAAALKGAPQPIVDKVTANLSRRAQEGLKEEIDLLGSIPGARVTQARTTVVEALQRLDERGEMVLLE